MPYRISGTLKLPSGVVASGVDIKFRALKSFSPLIEQAEITVRTDAAGKYDVSLEFNTYVCEVTYSTNRPFTAGQFTVAADTVAGQDLPTLLNAGGWVPATPEWIVQIQNWLAAANSAAQHAEASANSAKVSEVNSKNSETAAEADRAEVATKAADVVTKHLDVTAKALQVSQDAAATQTAKTTAVQAADTASQKAVSAATHDASAQDAATRAENAASAVVGAVLDGGECDLSSGIYPLPITVAGKKYSTIWYVAVAGTVSGVTFDIGDLLRYTTAKSGYYFKVDAKDDVYSVNGDKGAVTVTPEKIGAEKTGVAQTLVEQHSAKPDAHQISGIAGLRGVLDAKAGMTSLGIRNKIINGAMNIAQRNIPVTVSAGNFAYTLDRFAVGSKGSTTTVSRGTLPSGTKIPAINTLRVQGVAGTSEVTIRQLIEALNVQDTPVGAKLTFSVAVVGSSDLPASLRIFTGAAKDDFSNPTVVETKAITIPGAADASILFVTFTMTAAMRNGIGCDLVINSLGTGWVQTTAWQLEVGDVPTPLEFRPIGLELALCQRYCVAVQSLSVASETVGIGAYCTGTSIVAQMATPVEMRATPSWNGGVLSCAGPSGISPVTIIDKRGATINLMAPQAANRQGDSGYIVSSGVNAGFRGFIAEL